MHEYVGSLHVHTTYSDGAEGVEEVAAHAAKAGLDFLLISDHHTLAGLRDGKEGYHGRVLVGIGMEIGELHNHYLAWRLRSEVPDDPDDPQRVIDAVRAQGGIGFIAHPFEMGCKYGFSGRAFTWDDWSVTGYTGICIWNFTSQWKGPVTSPLKAVFYYLYRRGAVRAPDAPTLAAWDRELGRGKVVAIGGTDAHAFRFGIGPLRARIFPYRYLFKTIKTHVLTEKPLTGPFEADKAALYDALEKGRAFVSHGLMGDARGFRFTASSGAEEAAMGGDINVGEGVRFVIRLPRPGYVRLVRDGEPWREGAGGMQIYTARRPGVYRVEAYRQGITGQLRAWIFSNPIYVRP